MMARFNAPSHKAKAAVAMATSPLGTMSATPDTRTFEGAAGWTRNPKTELLFRASGAFSGSEDSFYEKGDKRDARLRELTRQVALEDPQWCLDFARWLRGPGNIRTGALMFAVEFVHERLAAGRTGRESHGDNAVIVEHYNRQIIDAVCQRADEPGEILAIWTAWYGRKIPKPVKRGVADAARRLYSEYSLLKYDTASHTYRFGDILNLVHAAPDPDKPWQGELFQYALDRRHNPGTAVPAESLLMVHANSALREVTDVSRWLVPGVLKDAGLTWEDALSAVDSKTDKAKLWSAMIPTMGYMALIRNLRNFDQAGVSDQVAKKVAAKLADADEVAKSRQFPFRFLSAYRATSDAGSLRWAYPLEQALNHSLVNVPRLGGRTLILVDRSPSMFPSSGHMYAGSNSKSDISLADQAAVFGAALALRAENATLVEFGGASKEIKVPQGGSVLKLVQSFSQINYTDIPSAVKRHYASHDRVVIITDEQTRAGYLPSNLGAYNGGMPSTPIDALIPLDVPVHMWNLAGYTGSAMPSGSNARFTMGGLTDRSFLLIERLESGAAGTWPWQLSAG
jgi:hypothetical protein